MKGQHIYYKCPPGCDKPHCPYCDGGLALCTVCGGAEGSLTMECCGRRITKEEEDRIYYQGNLDFRNGDWYKDCNYVRCPPPKPIEVPTKVVHCKKEPYDILIDRTTKWGNPFVIGKDGDRMQVIRKHLEWFVEQPDLLADLEELRGKRLGCWCGPEKPCHGDNFVFLLEGVWV